MESVFLKKFIKSKVPFYVEKLKVFIVDVYEEFNLVDIEDSSGGRFMVDISVLSMTPCYEKGISLKHLI